MLLVGIVEGQGGGGEHPSHNFYVCGAGAIAGCNCVYDSEDVALHHADEVEVVFTLGYFAKVLDEIHNVCTVVHGVLESLAYETLVCMLRCIQATYSFQLLKNT